MSAAPPPALVAGLQHIRRALAPCLTCQPDQLLPLLANQPWLEFMSPFSGSLVSTITASQPLLAASLRHILSDSTITGTVLVLLRRVHESGAAAPPPAARLRRPRTPLAGPPNDDLPLTVKASYHLNSLLVPFLNVAQAARSPQAVAVGGAFMLAVAQARPCAPLVATLALIQAAWAASAEAAAATSSDRAANRPAGYLHTFAGAPTGALTEKGRLCSTLAHSGCHLLMLSLESEPLAAALREDAAASRLLHHTCDTMAHLLRGAYGGLGAEGGAGGSSMLSVTLMEVQGLAQGATRCAVDAGGGGPLAQGRGARAAMLRTLFAEPAFARVLLAALMHYSGPHTLAVAGCGGGAPGRAGDTTATPAAAAAAAAAAGAAAAAMSDDAAHLDLLTLLQMLRFWLAPPGASGEQEAERTRLAAQVGVTAQHVAHMAHASTACGGEVTGNVAQLLYDALPSAADRARAMPAVAAHAASLLDRLTEWYRSGGTSDVFARDDLSRAWAEGLDPGRCSQQAVSLTLRLVSEESAGPSGPPHPLRTASLFVMRLGLLGKMEALLRARTCAPPLGLPAAARCLVPRRGPDDDVRHCVSAQLACFAAANTLAWLLDNEADATPALAVFLALLATTRKLMALVAADGSPRSKPTPATASPLG